MSPKWFKPPENPMPSLWAQVQEPKAVTITVAVCYLLTVVAGAATLRAETNSGLFVQGIVLILSGGIGVLSSLIGYFKMERPAVILAGTGVLMWIINTPLSLPSTMIGVLAIALWVTRYLRIRDLDVTLGEPVIHARRLTK